MPPRPRQGAPEDDGRRSESRLPLWGSALILLLGLGLLWLNLAVTIGGVVPTGQAARVQAWSPFDARLKAAAAQQILGQSGAANLGEIEALSEAAVRRDPTSVNGIRTLALVRLLQRRDAEAQALFYHAQAMSRRDIGTQLWLIEHMVQRNDIAGALRHFDIALRTSFSAYAILIPVMTSAAAEAPIARRIRALVERAPPWRNDFFEHLIQHGPSAATNVYLMRGLLRANVPGDQFLAQAAFSRLFRDNQVDLAWQLYDSIVGARAGSGVPLRDGGFDNVPLFPPVDWQLSADPSLSGIRNARDGAAENVALYAYFERPGAGEVARQMLRLAPGSYRLAATAANVGQRDRAQLTVRIACVSGASLASVTAPAADASGRRFEQGFAVPAGCTAQWLVIEAAQRGEIGEANPWIDDITISRGSGPAVAGPSAPTRNSIGE